MRAFIGCAVLVALVANVAADPGITWQAPAACPDLAEVHARIERRLGVPLDGVHGITVDVTREGPRFVAVVDLRGVTVANDVRTLTAARCDELADAVAVIVARVASERRSEASAVAAIAPAVPTIEPARAIVHRVDPLPPVRHRWGGGGRLLGLSGIGGVPQVGIGGEVGAYVRRDALIAEIAGARWVAGRVHVHSGAPAGVAVGLAVIALRVGWGPEHLPIRGWVGGEVGMMRGEGFALADTRVGSGRWIAANTGFGVAWPMAPRIRVVGNVELAVPLKNVNFQLEDGLVLYRSWPVSARASFGLEIGWR